MIRIEIKLPKIEFNYFILRYNYMSVLFILPSILINYMRNSSKPLKAIKTHLPSTNEDDFYMEVS